MGRDGAAVILWPAIDILDGQAVRLTRGQFGTETAYDPDPAHAARRWEAAGARALHVVDLDGARKGEPANLPHLERIAAAAEAQVQFGGGLRTVDSVRAAISAGADRVVLATAAYRDFDLLDRLLAEHAERIVVSLDVRHGRLAGAGWTEDIGIAPEAAAQRLGKHGVRSFVYSSIDRDGILGGPDLESLGRIGEALQGTFLYSGGVASLADLEDLCNLRRANLAGVIVGKALYEGRFTVAEGQSLLDGCPTSA